MPEGVGVDLEAGRGRCRGFIEASREHSRAIAVSEESGPRDDEGARNVHREPGKLGEVRRRVVEPQLTRFALTQRIEALAVDSIDDVDTLARPHDDEADSVRRIGSRAAGTATR